MIQIKFCERRQRWQVPWDHIRFLCQNDINTQISDSHQPHQVNHNLIRDLCTILWINFQAWGPRCSTEHTLVLQSHQSFPINLQLHPQRHLDDPNWVLLEIDGSKCLIPIFVCLHICLNQYSSGSSKVLNCPHIGPWSLGIHAKQV